MHGSFSRALVLVFLVELASVAQAAETDRTREQQELQDAQREGRRPHVPELAQRVALTELVYPQERHEFQVSVVPWWQRDQGVDSYLTKLELEYGLTDRLELDLGIGGGYVGQPVDGGGLGALGVAVLWSFVNLPRDRFASAVQLDARWPFDPDVSEQMGGEGGEVGTSLIAYYAPGPLAFNWELRVALQENEEQDAAGEETDSISLQYGAALATMADLGLGVLILESQLTREQGELGVQIAPGASVRPKDNMFVGVHVPLALTENVPDVSVILTYTISSSDIAGHLHSHD